MGVINSVLNALEKGDNVRDYAHASRTFVSNTYELQPRYGHLFHVVFSFTPDAAVLFDNVDKLEIPLLVKSVDLPTFSIDVETHNQYNRQVHSQHKINYNPVNIVFHDDQKDLIRTLWYKYYSYYYDDSLYTQGTGAYSTDDRYAQRAQNQWGLSRGNTRFFKDIRVYSMLQKRFAEYTLVNPIITSFNHSQHAYEGSNFMEHQMTLNYETVKYATGFVNNLTPRGFGDIHYDTTPSPIGIYGRGPSNSVLAAGGLLDSASSVVNDLAQGNILGAIVRGGLIFNNTRNINIRDVIENDLKRAAGKVLRGENPLSDTVIPKIFGSATGSGDLAGTVQRPPRVTAPGTSQTATVLVSSNGSRVSNTEYYDAYESLDVNIGNTNTIPQGTYSAAAPRRLSDVEELPRSATGIPNVASKLVEIQTRIRDLSAQIASNPTNVDVLRREQESLVERYYLESSKTIGI